MTAVLSQAQFFRLVARALDLDVGPLEATTPLEEVVVDSFAALELCVAIEEATGVGLEWDPQLVVSLGDLYTLYAASAVDPGVQSGG